MLAVLEVISKTEKELPRKNGSGTETFHSYKVKVKDGDREVIAEVFDKAGVPAPVPGPLSDDFYLDQTQYGLKLKKRSKMGGSGRGGRSPEELADIKRENA